jgi:hypothetical protein
LTDADILEDAPVQTVELPALLRQLGPPRHAFMDPYQRSDHAHDAFSLTLDRHGHPILAPRLVLV